MGKLMRALGLMSGTSMDGIDVALVTTDGEFVLERGPAMTFPYNTEMRSLLAEAMVDARDLTRRDERPGALPHAERELTEQHAAAVSGFLRKQNIARETIDVIGFHGQTVLHRPGGTKLHLTSDGLPYGTPVDVLTVQLGLGQMLAELTRLPVVYDLRADDCATGGQGAPLVPVYHQSLVAKLPQRPVAVVNIGGVANVTWIGRDGRLIAFDTGPGNALIDDWVRSHAGQDFDQDGALAEQGRTQVDIVHAYLTNAYFAEPPPKSLDRNAFTLDFVKGLNAENGAATLTQLTAETIARARQYMPEEPELWIVCGGGRKNRTLMRAFAGLVHYAVVPAEAVGLDGDAIEAEAWGYLAVRSLRGLPISFPGTTGVSEPMTGGRHVKANKGWGRL